MAMLYAYKVEIEVSPGVWSVKAVRNNWSAAERVQKKFAAQGLSARVVSHAIPMYVKTVIQ